MAEHHVLEALLGKRHNAEIQQRVVGDRPLWDEAAEDPFSRAFGYHGKKGRDNTARHQRDQQTRRFLLKRILSVNVTQQKNCRNHRCGN